MPSGCVCTPILTIVSLAKKNTKNKLKQNEMKWNQMRWDEMRWNEMKWNKMKQNKTKQAGAELGQAQFKLGLDFILIFCKFGSSSSGLVKLVGLLFRFGSSHLKHFVG